MSIDWSLNGYTLWKSMKLWSKQWPQEGIRLTYYKHGIRKTCRSRNRGESQQFVCLVNTQVINNTILEWAINLVHISNFLLILVETIINQPSRIGCLSPLMLPSCNQAWFSRKSPMYFDDFPCWWLVLGFPSGPLWHNEVTKIGFPTCSGLGDNASSTSFWLSAVMPLLIKWIRTFELRMQIWMKRYGDGIPKNQI